jgi:predicted transcriptional regulator
MHLWLSLSYIAGGVKYGLHMPQTSSSRRKYTTLNVDGSLYRELAELARARERTASAEARLAIRAHLERAGVDRPSVAGATDKLAAAGAAR